MILDGRKKNKKALQFITTLLKRQWHFLVKVYVLALMCFLPMAVAYTFYRKNFKLETIHVKDFPRIEIRSHTGEYKTIDDFKGKTILVKK